MAKNQHWHPSCWCLTIDLLLFVLSSSRAAAFLSSFINSSKRRTSQTTLWGMKGAAWNTQHGDSKSKGNIISENASPPEMLDDDEGWIAVATTRRAGKRHGRGRNKLVSLQDQNEDGDLVESREKVKGEMATLDGADGAKTVEEAFANDCTVEEKKDETGSFNGSVDNKLATLPTNSSSSAASSVGGEGDWKMNRKESKKKERQRRQQQQKKEEDERQRKKEAKAKGSKPKSPPPPPPGSLLETIQPCSPPTPFVPFMLILVGLPGSGKSTFARTLEQALPWKFVRINQDVLKTRIKCEALCYATLQEGRCPIIDRCNFDASQRGYFIALAREFGRPVDCVVFCASPAECIQRCRGRQGHETITPDKAAMVVNAMAHTWEPPRANDRKSSRLFRSIVPLETFAQADALAQEWISLQMAGTVGENGVVDGAKVDTNRFDATDPKAAANTARVEDSDGKDKGADGQEKATEANIFPT